MEENTDKLIRLPEVLEIIPYKKSNFLRLVKLGQFPKPVKIGPRAVAWSKKEIMETYKRIMDQKRTGDE